MARRVVPLLKVGSNTAGEGGADSMELMAGWATECNNGVPESMGEEMD